MSEIRVSTIGSSTPPYDTWETAFSDVQSAVNYASAGDTIVIDGGSYYPASKITIYKGIVVTSRYGSSLTVVDGGFLSWGCFLVGHADAVVEGITVRNGGVVSPG